MTRMDDAALEAHYLGYIERLNAHLSLIHI